MPPPFSQVVSAACLTRWIPGSSATYPDLATTCAPWGSCDLWEVQISVWPAVRSRAKGDPSQWDTSKCTLAACKAHKNKDRREWQPSRYWSFPATVCHHATPFAGHSAHRSFPDSPGKSKSCHELLGARQHKQMIHAGGISSGVLSDFECFKKQFWRLISLSTFPLQTSCSMFIVIQKTWDSAFPKSAHAHTPTAVLFKFKSILVYGDSDWLPDAYCSSTATSKSKSTVFVLQSQARCSGIFSFTKIF